MHRLKTAALACVALAALLSACSTSAGTGGKDATPTTTPPTSTTDSRATAFLDSVRATDFYTTVWATEAPDDVQLLVFPPKWCDAAAQGHSVKWMLGDGQATNYPWGPDWGTPTSSARQLVVLGITAYCPKYRDQVVNELRAYGEY